MREDVIRHLTEHGWAPASANTFRKGPAYLALSFNSFRVELVLLSVMHDARGAGHGTRAMKDLTQACDETGMNLLLTVLPMNKRGMNAEALISFYEKFGLSFAGKDGDGTPMMARKACPTTLEETLSGP